MLGNHEHNIRHHKKAPKEIPYYLVFINILIVPGKLAYL